MSDCVNLFELIGVAIIS